MKLPRDVSGDELAKRLKVSVTKPPGKLEVT